MSFISMEDVGITAVSHSRMKTHEGCPRKAKYKFIDKLKEPGNDAMNRGLEIHKQLEGWMVNGLKPKGGDYSDGVDIPRTGIYNRIRKDVARLKLGGYSLQPELQAAYDKDWEPCSWFGPQAWMRVVYDYVATHGTHHVLADYKTGKVYEDHDQQADLYALSAFKSGATAVDVVFYYIDQNTVQPYTYDPDELPALEEQVLARAEAVTSDRLYPTNFSWRCEYCHFRRENGGPCAH